MRIFEGAQLRGVLAEEGRLGVIGRGGRPALLGVLGTEGGVGVTG